MKNHSERVLMVIVVLPIFLFAVFGAGQKASEASMMVPRGYLTFDSLPYKEGELLVQMKPNAGLGASARAHSIVGASVIKSLRDGIELVGLPPGMDVMEGVALYRANPDVLHAEPNYIRVVKQRFPNDPLRLNLWGMHNIGQSGGEPDADIDAPEAWDFFIPPDRPGDSNVVIAVVDSGVDYTHEDLVANMWMNPAEAAGTPGVDDDVPPNGYVDDIYGINAITGAADPGDPMDDFGHGTHVAGTVGAVGSNATGVVGVNWDVQIMAVKFLDTSGVGTVADEIEALNYVADMANRGEKVVAVNASYGGYSPDFSFEIAAIDMLRESGILFAAAAGNDALDNDGLFHFPSSYDRPNIIAVAATTDRDTMASFSNFGRRTVHLGAPGVDIVSTLLGGGYGPFDIPWAGTSMATPHVAGTVGLLYASNPALDPVTDWPLVRNAILAGGDLNSFLGGKTVTGRRLNAYGAMACANSTILARIRPATSEYKAWLDPGGFIVWYDVIPGRNEVTVMYGDTFTNSLRLSALHINCENPNGNVVVTVGGQNVTLADDGSGHDVVPGDGVYSGTWVPPKVETSYTASFPNVGTEAVNAADTFTVHVRRTADPNASVVADAGRNRRVRPVTLVTLDGSISSGLPSTATPLYYAWTELCDGCPTVTLNDANTPFPFFEAPALGSEKEIRIVFELVVSDLDGNTDSDTVTITVSESTGGGGGGGSSSCFIATAAYGSESERDVVLLRRFRDEYLLTSAPGRALVQFYYEYSPPVASFVSEHLVLRKAARAGLLPAVTVARVMLATNGLEKLLIVIFLGLMIGGTFALSAEHRKR